MNESIADAEPLPIADTEALAIFVYDSRKMKADGAHWTAFLPGKHDGERSFFRVDRLEEADIAEIGKTGTETRVDQELRGWSQLFALDVRRRPPLTLKASEPPPRHGVIIGWPSEPQDKKALAMALAGVAQTIRC